MSRAALAAAALVLVAVAAVGCGRSDTEDPMTSGTNGGATAAASQAAAGEAALTDTGRRVQDVVRGIVEPVAGVETKYDPGLSRTSCADAASDDPWPQQDSFHADVFIRGDSRPAGQQAVERLRADGWTVEDAGRLTGPGTQHWVARRDGYVVTIGSTAADVAALTVTGSTPCVAADGTTSAPSS